MDELTNKRLCNDDFLKDEKKLACFFRGEEIPLRMDYVRESIHYVRDNWYDDKWHKEMIDKLYREYTIAISKDILLQKDWIDEINVPEINRINFDLIKYYTSNAGYDNLKEMNESFRKRKLNKEKCNIATYLVELFNIELYNYIKIISSCNNFEGKIYRGFVPNCEQAANVFDDIISNSISDRQIAIPLEFMSASRLKSIAESYIDKAEKGLRDIPYMFEINVRNLNKELLKIYKTYYPDSPVTSLCSVPIDTISSNPNDKEVLLRGAFLQVLKVHKTETPVRVELMMLNANRDHIKTHKYKDTNAQNLFRSLVKQDKMRICKELSDNEKDRNDYAEAENLAKLEVEKNIEISEKENIKTK